MKAFLIVAAILSVSAYAGIVTSPSTPIAYTGVNGPIPVRTGTPLPVVIPGGVVVNNPSIGTIGAVAPTSATQMGGVDGLGNLVAPLVIGGGMNTNSNISLFQGAAPSASNFLPFRLTNGSAYYDSRDRNWSLTSSDVVTVVQPSGASLHVEVDASALPTGASTSANQATEIASLASIDGKLTGPLAVTGPLTDTELRATAVPVSGPLTDTQLRATPVPVSGTVAVTGVATEATLAAVSAQLPATLGQKTMANSMAVVLASNQSAIPVTQGGSTPAYTIFYDYSAFPVSQGVWGAVVASSPVATTRVDIFDSSGQAIYLGYGASTFEVEQFVIFPGGNGSMSLSTPSSTRISVKPITAAANSGFLILNFFN